MRGFGLKNILKHTLISLGVLLAGASLFMVMTPGSAYADAKNEVCEAIGGCSGGGATISKTIKTIINIMGAIGSVIAIIMIIIGGIRYITSSGDSNSTASARNTIIYALIGLVVIAFSQVIVQFVLERT